jgi:hypothetical protein
LKATKAKSKKMPLDFLKKLLKANMKPSNRCRQ